MAVLSDAARQALWAELMQVLSVSGESIGITKADLRAAVNAADNWVDSNASSYNQALPQPARGALSPEQKARLLLFVVRHRFEVD